MMNQELLEALCSIIEEQNDIIKAIATRLNERDDVDLIERAEELQKRKEKILGTPSEGGAA